MKVNKIPLTICNREGNFHQLSPKVYRLINNATPDIYTSSALVRLISDSAHLHNLGWHPHKGYVSILRTDERVAFPVGTEQTNLEFVANDPSL